MRREVECDITVLMQAGRNTDTVAGSVQGVGARHDCGRHTDTWAWA
jgi:hypothetical protein